MAHDPCASFTRHPPKHCKPSTDDFLSAHANPRRLHLSSPSTVDASLFMRAPNATVACQPRPSSCVRLTTSMPPTLSSLGPIGFFPISGRRAPSSLALLGELYPNSSWSFFPSSFSILSFQNSLLPISAFFLALKVRLLPMTSFDRIVSF